MGITFSLMRDAAVTALTNSISNIVLLGTKEKMGGIDARRVIADMTHKQPIRYGAIVQLIAITVCAHLHRWL